MQVPPGFSLVVAEGSIGTLLSAIFGIMCARYWGPEISGTTSMAFTVAALFSFLSCLSIEQIVIARYARTSDHEALFLATVVLRGIAICASFMGVSTVAGAMSGFFGEWLLLPVLSFLQLAISSMDLIRLRAQAIGKIHLQSRPRICVIIVFFALKVAALASLPATESVWSTVVLSIAETSVLLLVSILVNRSTSPLPLSWPPNWKGTGSEIDYVLRSSIPLFGAGFLIFLFFRLDYFVLEKLSSIKDIGLYASSMRIVEMYASVGGLALVQIYPSIAREHSVSIANYESSLKDAFRFAYLSAAGIILFNFVVGEWLIRTLLGAQYEETAKYSTFFCFLVIPLLSGTVRGFAISLQELHSNHFFAALTGLAVSVPLLFFLVPVLGFKGALIADLVAYGMSAMLSSLLIPSLRSIGRLQFNPGITKGGK